MHSKFTFLDLIIATLGIGGVILFFTSHPEDLITKSISAFEILCVLLYFFVHHQGMKPVLESARTIYSNATKADEAYQLKRKKAFTSLFPRLNKTPVFGPLSQRVYSQGFLVIMMLVVLTLTAFTLRVTELTNLQPYTDEYIHLAAAKGLLATGEPLFVLDGAEREPYTRSFFITAMLAFFFGIFGDSLFIGRILGVIASTLTIVPLYLLGRYIHRYVGVLAALLWTVSPWSIAVARNIREYAYLPFFYLLVCIGLISFRNQLLNTLEKKVLPTISFYITGTLLLLPLLYSFVIDTFSTFKQIVLLYAVFFVVICVDVFRSPHLGRVFKRNTAIAIGSLIIVGVAALSTLSVGHVNLAPTLNTYWFDLALGNVSNQWAYDTFGMYIFYFILITTTFVTFLTFKNTRRLSVPLILFITFLVYLYFFVFHFDRYVRPRYGYIFLVWLTPLLSIGLYYLYQLTLIPKKYAYKVLLVIIALGSTILFLHPQNTITSFTMDDHGYVPITNEHHDDLDSVIEKYGEAFNNAPVFICTLCIGFVWNDVIDPIENNAYSYGYEDENRFTKVEALVTIHEHGYMALDWRRNGRWTEGFPKRDFELGGKQIVHIEKLGSFDIYTW
jgi:hypothetical protein